MSFDPLNFDPQAFNVAGGAVPPVPVDIPQQAEPYKFTPYIPRRVMVPIRRGRRR